MRLPTGEEFGPISSSSLQRLIEKGMVTYADEIGEDPERNFQPLAQSKFIQGTANIPKLSTQPHSKEEVTEELQKSISKTVAAPDDAFEKFGQVKVSVIKSKFPRPNFEALESHTPSRPRPGKTIELKPRSRKKRNLKDIAIKVTLGVVILGSLSVLLLPDQASVSDEAIHLVSPKENTRQLNDAQLNEIYTKAKAAFESDTFSGYLFAMNQLVMAAESVTHKSEALSLLCLSYFELWPFSYRDGEDLAAVTKLSQMSAKVDPLGPHGGSCRAIQQLVSGKMSDANSILDSLLSENPGVGHLYLLKAHVLENQGNFTTALAYTQKAEQLWPQWFRPYLKEAFYLFRSEHASDAANRLRELQKSRPKHSGVKALLGIVEQSAFRHSDAAIELLKPVLTAGDRLESGIKAEAAFALARAYGEKQDKSSAVDWGKKAYAWDPTIVGLKEFLVGLAGEKVFDGMSKTDRENVALGDQYFVSSNYLSAQAHFKAAFENNPKNALAAFKAGQSLWKLNQGIEATEWFKKAIQADPTKIESYVALADVYSSRFDFFAASAILQKAQKQAPKNYEVYRGFASLALKRNDFNGAISSAKKALSLYDTDMPSTLILARAYWGSGQVREAYTYASHAIELEKTNAEAQTLYGTLLADAQGSEASISYLQNLVNTYPRVPDYGVALASILLTEGRPEKATEAIQQVLAISPQNKPALLTQGRIFGKLKKIEDALASFFSAAALDPSDGEPLFLAGQLYLNMNQPTPAIAQFQRVLLLNTNYPKVHMFISKAALLTGDKDRALKEVALEKRINPGLAEPYLVAGDINLELKQYAKAAAEYQAALKLSAQGADVYIRLARVYRLSSQYDVALSMLRTAEARESGNAEVAKEFGAVYELKGDNMGAVKFYNRYLQILPNAPDRSAITDRINHLGGAVE